MRKRIALLVVPFILAGLLSGCDRIGLFDTAKNGVDVVYSMGFDTIEGDTMLDIARPGYHQQYDTMTSIVPTMIGAGSRSVFAVVGGAVWTHSDSYTSWASLGGTTPSAVYFMADRDGEVILLGDWAAMYNLCRLHEDSFQESDPFEDRSDITTQLGSFIPISMFKASGSESIYLFAFFSTTLKIFNVSSSGISEIVNHPVTTPPGSINSAGKKGRILYMLDNSGRVYKMSASGSETAQEYPATGASSIAMTESGIYAFYNDTDGHLAKFNETTGLLTAEIRVFLGASNGEIVPFDRDGVAIRLSGGTEQGVWVYKDGDYKHIITGPSDAMYVR